MPGLRGVRPARPALWLTTWHRCQADRPAQPGPGAPEETLPRAARPLWNPGLPRIRCRLRSLLWRKRELTVLNLQDDDLHLPVTPGVKGNRACGARNPYRFQPSLDVLA